MQAFEFAKQGLLHLRRQKQQLLQAGDIASSPHDPITLTLAAEISYDDTHWPVKEIDIDFISGEGDDKRRQRHRVEVPEGAILNNDHDVHNWLESVGEFMASCHGLAVAKAEDANLELSDSSTNTQVFKLPDAFKITWQTTEGLLSEIPMESAGLQMDALMKRTLEGWEDSTERWNDSPGDDSDTIEKHFENPQEAGAEIELLYQILAINGHSQHELDESLQLDDDDDIIKIPRTFLEKAITAEQYFGFLNEL